MAVQSIIENASAGYEYHIIIFDCGINPADIAVLERQIAKYAHFRLAVENIIAWLNKHQHIAAKSGWHRSIYGRLLVPELCLDYEKVIYADADMIFNRDMAELTAIDLGKNYIAAGIAPTKEMARALGINRTISFIRDRLGMADDQAYINSGLLVYNIKAWQKNKLSAKALQFLADNKTRFPDQDAINAVCKGNICYLPQYWNCVMRNERSWRDIAESHKDNERVQALYNEWLAAYERADNIIHFIGLKPWISLLMPKAAQWWRYAAKIETHDRLFAEALCFHNQADLARQGEPLVYRFLGLPLLSVRARPGSKKYYFGKMRNRHIAEIRHDARTGYAAFYLLEMKLFTREARWD